MILINLSGEHPDLPLEEVEALYEAYGKKPDIILKDGRLLLVKNGLEKSALARLALTHEFYEVAELADGASLDEVLLGLKVKKPESFRVRCLGFDYNAGEERRAGGVLFDAWAAKGWKPRVKMEKPELEIYIIKVKDKVAISFEKNETGDFKKRDPNKRPFFHPLALNPKLARLFLNLARLKTGDRVLDPFCGSGSVLIEATLMGLDATGGDRDHNMLWGCAKNMAFYGVNAETFGGDATDIKLRKLDAIVTDPPYARSSKVFSKDLQTLYDAFLKSAFRALKPGGHLVLAVPTEAKLNYKQAGFEKRSDHKYYVHRSLTRRIYILRRAK